MIEGRVYLKNKDHQNNKNKVALLMKGFISITY